MRFAFDVVLIGVLLFAPWYVVAIVAACCAAWFVFNVFMR